MNAVDLIVMRFQILPFTQRKGYLMGMAYCPVFDNEEVDNSFNEFNYFPLELDTLDRLTSEIKVTPLSDFVYHDPDSSPTLYLEGFRIVYQRRYSRRTCSSERNVGTLFRSQYPFCNHADLLMRCIQLSSSN